MMNSRARTAMARKVLSAPMRYIAAQFGPRVLYDYGCGRGTDVDFLTQTGVMAYGYDPFYPKPIKNNKCILSSEWGANQTFMPDTVTCIYVLNVIPDIEERRQVVRKLLENHPEANVFFAVRTDKIKGEVTGDGVMTDAGTFQKSYRSGELLDFITSLTNRPVTGHKHGLVQVSP